MSKLDDAALSNLSMMVGHTYPDAMRNRELHSLARFNANCYRRIAYKNGLAYEQRKLHESTEFGAFTSERMLGCPATWRDRYD